MRNWTLVTTDTRYERVSVLPIGTSVYASQAYDQSRPSKVPIYFARGIRPTISPDRETVPRMVPSHAELIREIWQMRARLCWSDLFRDTNGSPYLGYLAYHQASDLFRIVTFRRNRRSGDLIGTPKIGFIKIDSLVEVSVKYPLYPIRSSGVNFPRHVFASPLACTADEYTCSTCEHVLYMQTLNLHGLLLTSKYKLQ